MMIIKKLHICTYIVRAFFRKKCKGSKSMGQIFMGGRGESRCGLNVNFTMKSQEGKALLSWRGSQIAPLIHTPTLYEAMVAMYLYCTYVHTYVHILAYIYMYVSLPLRMFFVSTETVRLPPFLHRPTQGKTRGSSQEEVRVRWLPGDRVVATTRLGGTE